MGPTTMLLGVCFGWNVSSYLIDAIIGLPVVYKAMNNLGAFLRWLGLQLNTNDATLRAGSLIDRCARLTNVPSPSRYPQPSIRSGSATKNAICSPWCRFPLKPAPLQCKSSNISRFHEAFKTSPRTQRWISMRTPTRNSIGRVGVRRRAWEARPQVFACGATATVYTSLFKLFGAGNGRGHDDFHQDIRCAHLALRCGTGGRSTWRGPVVPDRVHCLEIATNVL